MIISRNKIQQFVFTLTLLSLLWANFNVFYFTHSHINKNGKMIVHAHFYQKENQKNNDIPNHTHSKSEFTLLALIYRILSLFTFSLFAFHFLLPVHRNFKIKFSSQWNPTGILCKNILKRGPPYLIQFS